MRYKIFFDIIRILLVYIIAFVICWKTKFLEDPSQYILLSAVALGIIIYTIIQNKKD